MYRDKLRILFAGGLLTCVMASSSASVSFYYTEAAFTLALNGGAGYFEEFPNWSYGFHGSSFSSTNGTFGWTATSTGVGNAGLYQLDLGGNGALSTLDSSNPLIFTFDTGNVTAFGGYFFNSDDPGTNIGGNIELTVDGTTYSSTSLPSGFFGAISDSGVMTDARIFGDGGNSYASADHVFAGGALNPVPEPFTLGLGVAGVAAFVRRRVRSKSS